MRKASIAALTALSLAISPAYADHGYYGRDYREHRHRDDSAWVGLAIVGAIAGLALMADQSRPRYATAPAYVEPAYPPSQPIYTPPPVYSMPAPDAPGTAYYCGSSGMYYPQARACPEGWQAIPPRQY